MVVAPTLPSSLPSTFVTPTVEQVSQTKRAIDAYVQSIASSPNRREGAYPYYLFHDAGQPIRGTVMLFHGFSARPDQLWRLADYLFRSGFNVYQASIAGHPMIPPRDFWAQVDLKPEIANPLKAKVQQDPVLQAYFANVASNPDGLQRPDPVQQAALMARLLKIEPRLLNIMQAIESDEDPAFDQYFISSHLNYLTDAQARLKELDAMPGDVYTVGLSVGGAVALALAAQRPDRVKKVVAYAPLLKIYGEDRRQYVLLSGPLDISEQGWDPNLRFPVGCFTAADRFGGTCVDTASSIVALQHIPTFMVLTENEDAADIQTNQNFFAAIGGSAKGHRFFIYPAADLVPHPMVDPTEVSRNMSNRFWQRLYQETYRFLVTGDANVSQLDSLQQDPDLPSVPPV